MTEEEQRARIMDESYLEEVEGVARTELNINAVIPTSFDARVKWPACTSIKTIRDQSACGSCWAVSGASAMSDRLCVQSNGKIKKFVSDADILACCGSFCGYGCKGGYTIRAWQFATSTGACTGGAYAQKGVCKPYPFHPCGQHKGQPYYGNCPSSGYPTPACEKKCQSGYTTPYASDKLRAKSSYYVTSTVEAIQKEIMTNGPVQASFSVYADFYSYKSGIYVHTAGARKGGHAIKIIGWGVDKNVPYWLISNSWNSDWGENGLFRIARGKNECGIESRVVAGMMQV
ncbi:papain family cysteine protease [Oesophagostomum dentatum]|uniref:Papain family cysteine protease n=1 Tax=Oesophagostomum dentatum TaxID=61180 RepID=A0A0B1TQ40_OESDE|nr:papain family cysteine protease [Oesophagostomum dentatum]